MNKINFLKKKINLNLLCLYLKYGYISIPPNKTIDKKKNLNSWIKKFNNEHYLSIHDLLRFLDNYFYKFVKKQINKKKKICLLLSSGSDSRLIYNLLLKNVLKLNYRKNFFCITGYYRGYKDKYNELNLLEKKWISKPLNHIKVSISNKNFLSNIKKLNLINHQPINGYPVNTIYHVCKKLVKKFTPKKVVAVAGINDPIFFNSTLKQYHLSNIKKIFNIAGDKTLFDNDIFLNDYFNNLAVKEFKKIKIKKYFKIKNQYHKYINKMAFYFRSPKTAAEFINIFEHFKLEFFAPFIDKTVITKILSLKKKDLHDGKNPKTAVIKMNKILNTKQKNYQGILMQTPQRELVYKNYKSIIQLIENSLLVKYGIVNKKIILRNFNNYINKYNNCINNENKFKKVNSYEIWKFISSELFLRNIKK